MSQTCSRTVEGYPQNPPSASPKLRQERARPLRLAPRPGRTSRLAAPGRNVRQMCANGGATDAEEVGGGNSACCGRTAFLVSRCEISVKNGLRHPGHRHNGRYTRISTSGHLWLLPDEGEAVTTRAFLQIDVQQDEALALGQGQQVFTGGYPLLLCYVATESPLPLLYSGSRRAFLRLRLRAKACLTRSFWPGFK